MGLGYRLGPRRKVGVISRRSVNVLLVIIYISESYIQVDSSVLVVSQKGEWLTRVEFKRSACESRWYQVTLPLKMLTAYQRWLTSSSYILMYRLMRDNAEIIEVRCLLFCPKGFKTLSRHYSRHLYYVPISFIKSVTIDFMESVSQNNEGWKEMHTILRLRL